MVVADHAHGDRKLGVVLLHDHLARLEELKLGAATHAGLVDLGQQGRHLGLARQLLLELPHELLDLVALLAQRHEVDRLRDLFGVLLLEQHFLLDAGVHLLEQASPVEAPARRDDRDEQGAEQQAARQRGPQAGVAALQALQLGDNGGDDELQGEGGYLGHRVRLGVTGPGRS